MRRRWGFSKRSGRRSSCDWTRGFSTLFANREEAEALSGVAELDEQMRVLGATYARVVIKLGADGRGGRRGRGRAAAAGGAGG